MRTTGTPTSAGAKPTRLQVRPQRIAGDRARSLLRPRGRARPCSTRRGQRGKTNVVSLVAWGGVGKSTLVNKWLEALEADNWRGAGRVLGWSFYSQGTDERVTSADQFVDDALACSAIPIRRRARPGPRASGWPSWCARRRRSWCSMAWSRSRTRYQGIKDPALAAPGRGAGAGQPRALRDHHPRARSGSSPISRTTSRVTWSRSRRRRAAPCWSHGRARRPKRSWSRRATAFGNHALAINLLASYLRAIPRASDRQGR